ncbi:MAG TPA: hypothetical protein VME69_10070 [Methylocella sp.]|nr:hypothetical protein [Methylocella sp.]
MSGGNFGDIINAVTGIGHAIGDLLDLGLVLLTGGATGPIPQALSDLLTIFKYGLAVLFFTFWGRYSFVVLAAASLQEARYARREYDKLRDNLTRGGTRRVFIRSD